MDYMTTSKDGLAMIKESEGLRLRAYKALPTETYYTIGIGHYGADVTPDMVISEERAEHLFRQDVRPIEAELNGMHINFRQGQFDALVSLIFNIGLSAFRSSTLRRKIAAGASNKDIIAEFRRWTKSGGQTVAGLQRRREQEILAWCL